MGNAVVTIHHPTSLDHGIPYLESGKIVESIPGMLRLEKKDSAAVGCGGRVSFKKNVLDSQYTYRIIKEVSASFGIGREITVTAGSELEASAQVAVMIGITVTEVSECVTLIHTSITDENDYSEMYCYVDWAGDNGRHYWTKNDLDLKATHRWAESSEMIIDVEF